MEKLYKTKAITEGVFYTRNDACEEDEDLYTLSEIEFFAIDEEASDIDNKKINEIQESVINTETDNTLMMYLKEIGEHELLSPEEEIELAIRVRNGNFAREQKDDLIKEGFELSAVNLKELDDMIADGEEARETLINSNLKLVVFVAKKYAPVNGMELQDLIQEGNFGLMKAVDKFDPDRGFRFATFAVWWIRQAITRAIANTGRIV